MLLVRERPDFLLLVSLEALLFLLLVSGEFLQIALLLEFQPLALARLVSAEVCPVLFPPGLVKFVLVKFGGWPGRALRRVSVAGIRWRLSATRGSTFCARRAGQRGVENIPDVVQQAVIIAIVPGFGLTLREPGTR
jgi:hypothetical protein